MKKKCKVELILIIKGNLIFYLCDNPIFPLIDGVSISCFIKLHYFNNKIKSHRNISNIILADLEPLF